MTRYFCEGKPWYDDLVKLMRDRHNAMLADQAAEAINDFRVALYLLCRRGGDAFEDEYMERRIGGPSPYQRLIRGLR